MNGLANHRVISFYWKRDNNLAKNLILVEPLKYGFLYKHKHFNQFWYLDGDEEYMHRVRNNQYDLLMEWSDKRITLSADQKNILSTIGATEADMFGNRRGKIKIPALAVLNSGKAIDPCLIQISRLPPFIYEDKKIIFGDEVSEFGPTKYALSQEVRIESYTADELRMGFAPTLVESKNGDQFILNWSNDIFEYGDIRGEDIILSPTKYNFDIVAPILGTNEMKYCLVYFDWYEGCESLLI